MLSGTSVFREYHFNATIWANQDIVSERPGKERVALARSMSYVCNELYRTRNGGARYRFEKWPYLYVMKNSLTCFSSLNSM